MVERIKKSKTPKKAAPTQSTKPTFDPVAVGDRITSHLAEADKNEAAAGKLLLDVAQNHREHLEPICERIGLGRSRRSELMMIARGERSPEQTKARTKGRVTKHRAAQKKAKAPLQDVVTDDPDTNVIPLKPRSGASHTADDDVAQFKRAIETFLELDGHGDPKNYCRAVPKKDLWTTMSFLATIWQTFGDGSRNCGAPYVVAADRDQPDDNKPDTTEAPKLATLEPATKTQ